MSLSSEELNYLIWRYLQESGHELTTLALQEESRVLEFDSQYKLHVPVGSLVNLIQKGILYTESELLVKSNGDITKEEMENFNENFNLVNALQIDLEKYPEIAKKGRFALANDSESQYEERLAKGKKESEINTPIIPTSGIEEETNTKIKADIEDISIHNDTEDSAESSFFAKTLNEVQTLDNKVVTSSWNLQNERLLAYGQEDSMAKMIEYNKEDKKIISSLELRHPFALSSITGRKTNQITALSWSPDGELIITSVENGELRLWNKDGRLQNVFNFHRSPIVSIKWNEDSKHFISLDLDNITILWNAINGIILQHFEPEQKLENNTESLGVDIEWVDKDKLVVPGVNGSILVYSIDDNKPIGKLLGHQGTISCIEFNVNSRLLLTSSDSDYSIRIWHGQKSNCCNCFYGHSQSIISLSWINDDLVISASMDGSVRIWSVVENCLVGMAMVDGNAIICGKISHDKNKFAIGSMNGQINVYDIKRFVSRLLKRDKKQELVVPITIPLYGSYQNEKIDDCIFDISWNKSNDLITVANSIGEGSIIAIN